MRLSLNKTSLKQQRDHLEMYRRFLPSLDLKRQQLLAAWRSAEREPGGGGAAARIGPPVARSIASVCWEAPPFARETFPRYFAFAPSSSRTRMSWGPGFPSSDRWISSEPTIRR